MFTSRFYTRREVAALLGRSVRQLSRDRQTGLVPVPDTPPGRHPRWLRSAIDRWIEDGCPPPTTRVKSRTR